MWRRSITFRLAFYFCVASTAVLLAIGYVVGISVERHFLDLDHVDLLGKMELVRHVLSTVRTAADIDALPGRLNDALIGHESLSVSITGPGGSTVYKTVGAAFPPQLIKEAPSWEPS